VRTDQSAVVKRRHYVSTCAREHNPQRVTKSGQWRRYPGQRPPLADFAKTVPKPAFLQTVILPLFASK
jgi:hypothetical protein